MTEPLLTIGVFARAVDLAPSALRYYDEAGLLTPTEIDQQTGYRYYTAAQERRAHLIRRMREIGVSVETMRLVLESAPEHAAELLHGYAARAADSARLTATVTAEVVSSLRTARSGTPSMCVPVDGPELAVALRRVCHATDAEPASPLHATLLDITDSTLCEVATDRYRMAAWSIPLAAPATGNCRLVVDVDEVPGLVSWLSRRQAVSLSVDGQQVTLLGDSECGPDELNVPTIDDRFPSYRLVFDDQPDSRGRVTVDRAAMLGAIEVHSEQVRLVTGREHLAVSAGGQADGKHITALTSGERATLWFPARLLNSTLAALVGPTVQLSYATPDRAVRFSSPEQRNFVILVMPSRAAI